MKNGWSDVQFFNSILAKAKQEEKEEAIQIYFQQLWQMDNLVILIGAGFSKHINGPLMSDLSKGILPVVIMKGYNDLTSKKQPSKDWKRIWNIGEGVEKDLKERIEEKNPESPESLVEHCSSINIEEKISELQVIISSYNILKLDNSIYKDALESIKTQIVKTISAITPDVKDNEFSEFTGNIQPYRSFLRRLIKYRRPQQPRIRIFTSNYDKVIESACDLEGITCINGFEGKHIQIFNPTAFDLDTNFKATGQSGVYYANLIQLFKLHGSIDWTIAKIDGIEEIIQGYHAGGEVLIYPCYTKFAEALEAPYSEMFRRFGEAVSQPQTILLSLGYGFTDEHINQMILKAYKNPSCQLLLCEPVATPTGIAGKDFFNSLLKMAQPEAEAAISDPRVTVLGGESIRFPEVLNILFAPLEIESPSEEIRNLVRRLVEMGKSQ